MLYLPVNRRFNNENGIIFVDTGNDKLLKLMYAIAKEYNEDDDYEYSFSPADIAAFEERRNKRLNGESKTYDWETAKAIITGKKKPDAI